MVCVCRFSRLNCATYALLVDPITELLWTLSLNKGHQFTNVLLWNVLKTKRQPRTTKSMCRQNETCLKYPSMQSNINFRIAISNIKKGYHDIVDNICSNTPNVCYQLSSFTVKYLCLIYLNLCLMSTCVWYISTWAWCLLTDLI